MFNYNIAFDLENKLEYFYYYQMKKYRNEYASVPNNLRIKIEPKPIGTFFLKYLNTDFTSKDNFNKFVLEYCFGDLFYNYNSMYKKNMEKYYKNYQLHIQEKELPKILDKLYKQFSEDFIYFRESYMHIIESTHRYHDGNYNNVDLSDLYDLADNLQLDFTMQDFYNLEERHQVSANIPYSLRSNTYFCMVFISFKQALGINNTSFKKCVNCNKYFIPKTTHDTKYCDEIFKGKKTCKQIGRDLAFKESLEKEPLLKAYRSRYQTLSKQAGQRDNHEMYDYFKVEGPKTREKFKNGEITAEEFQAWIDSTKFRNKKN